MSPAAGVRRSRNRLRCRSRRRPSPRTAASSTFLHFEFAETVAISPRLGLRAARTRAPPTVAGAFRKRGCAGSRRGGRLDNLLQPPAFVRPETKHVRRQLQRADATHDAPHLFLAALARVRPAPAAGVADDSDEFRLAHVEP